MTLSIVTFIRMTFSIMPLIRMPLSKMHLIKMSLSTMPFTRMTLCIMPFIRMTFSMKNTQGSGFYQNDTLNYDIQQNNFAQNDKITLNNHSPKCRYLCFSAKYHFAECRGAFSTSFNFLNGLFFTKINGIKTSHMFFSRIAQMVLKFIYITFKKQIEGELLEKNLSP